MNVHATSVVAVRKDGCIAMASDGQVSVEHAIFKSGARKVQRLYEGKVLAGFAGSAADALTLFEKFEGKLEEYKGNLQRAALELVKEWRTDRILRRLEAMLMVGDAENLYLVSGSGDIIEPDEDASGIGSGGGFAQAAALALIRHSSLSAEEIAREAIRTAAEICVFTNDRVTVETIP
ncbi:MAG: ATP-dependent protease subunit HslV [Armatimonadota bacterium]|jgi:ATP-dependent HslUV protease subunit HslV